ncbi:MAG TPA: UDP-N-acetylmuramoyl-tripeptide--D-alanyl-D-alanine ligase [Steroidobacteraceae bacterium]|nr:UDP-N-acetylmuramoyl-tripeptide--D-alanyl-D-alanine ligase [Steroidobacteraceae bacterium]
MKRTTGDAARVLGGRLVGEDKDYGVVSSDSRTLEPGSLFVALRGPNFDGADFAAAAAARGAAAALVERQVAAPLTQIIVPDALGALQRLASAWRAQFNCPIVGVAGSNGKTTAKTMTAAILSRMGACMATQGNLNNHIGVPLTLMRLAAVHRSAVVEMGANRIGDVAELVQIAVPTIGLITNAGAEHLEGFGDLDGVARGEGEMVAGLAPEGTAVINADDPYAGYWRSIAGARRIVTFGANAPAAGRAAPGDFIAKDPVQSIAHGEFQTRFTLQCPLGERSILLKAGGAHNIANALAAAAAAAAAGASLENIAAGLADFRAVSGRLQLKAGPRGSWIIDDSYNANPSSVRAGLEVLRSLSGATWLVFADMAELGEETADMHAHVGSYARDCGVKRLFALGVQSSRAVETFGAGGEWFADPNALIRRLQSELESGVTVLVKGSRVNRLERVVQALTGGGKA